MKHPGLLSLTTPSLPPGWYCFHKNVLTHPTGSYTGFVFPRTIAGLVAAQAKYAMWVRYFTALPPSNAPNIFDHGQRVLDGKLTTNAFIWEPIPASNCIFFHLSS